MIVIDTAKDGDAREGTLDRSRIAGRRPVGLQGGRPFIRGEPSAGPGGRLVEVAERHQLLAPGRHSTVSGQLFPGLPLLLVEIPGWSIRHSSVPQISGPAAHAVDVARP